MLCSCFYHQHAAETWSTSLDVVPGFCPCTLLAQAVEDCWRGVAQAHRKTLFPQYVLNSAAGLIQSINVSLTQVSDGRDT